MYGIIYLVRAGVPVCDTAVHRNETQNDWFILKYAPLFDNEIVERFWTSAKPLFEACPGPGHTVKYDQNVFTENRLFQKTQIHYLLRTTLYVCLSFHRQMVLRYSLHISSTYSNSSLLVILYHTTFSRSCEILMGNFQVNLVNSAFYPRGTVK